MRFASGSGGHGVVSPGGFVLAPASPGAIVITLTTAAATRIQALCQKQGKPQGFLRLRVTSGGCAGMNLEFEISDAASQEDKAYEGHGAKVVVDPKSEFFLYGSQVDYESSLMKSGFVVKNPNAKDTCSCGASFST